ncbi:MAG: lytic transglycosylase domain-containing protein [Oscillospiraceae bacterium]|nr:lytic transglycosylase domain-containing protein [Oscillospiraceae bacterium]
MKAKKLILTILLVLAACFLAKSLVYHDLYRLQYKGYILESSEKYDVDPYLVMAVVNTESKFNKNALSSSGAVGLMQLTESTAKWVAQSSGDREFELSDLYNPKKNIEMGVWYIHNLQQEFGRTDLVLAAYNAGRGNVEKWLSDGELSKDGQTLSKIPYEETRNYLKKVLAGERIYRMLYKAD